MRIRKAYVVALLIWGSGPATLAQSEFEKNDANKDGKISRHEFYSNVEDFGANQYRDKDRDNRLDRFEFDEIGSHAKFENWDSNGDSFLNTNEFYDGVYGHFDVDRNGYLDDTEWDGAGHALWFNFSGN